MIADQKNDTITIKRWLEDLVRSTGTPKEFCIESHSLLMASVQAFTQFETTVDYLQRCHSILEGADHLQIPTCFIREDVSGFVNNLERSPIFNSERCKVKKFYLNAINLLLKIDDFDEIKKIIEDILIMVYTEFESIETEMSRKGLNLLFEIHSIENICSEIIRDNNGEDDVFEIFNTENKHTSNWFQVIKNKVLNLNHDRDEQKDNFLYFPKFLPYVESVIYKVPTWGAVMKKYFNSPNLNISSSKCDFEFKFVKRNSFKDFEPTSVDKFLLQHVRDIIGKMILVVPELNKHLHIKNGIFYNTIFYIYIFVNLFLNFLGKRNTKKVRDTSQTSSYTMESLPGLNEIDDEKVDIFEPESIVNKDYSIISSGSSEHMFWGESSKENNKFSINKNGKIFLL